MKLYKKSLNSVLKNKQKQQKIRVNSLELYSVRLRKNRTTDRCLWITTLQKFQHSHQSSHRSKKAFWKNRINITHMHCTFHLTNYIARFLRFWSIRFRAGSKRIEYGLGFTRWRNIGQNIVSRFSSSWNNNKIQMHKKLLHFLQK